MIHSIQPELRKVVSIVASLCLLAILQLNACKDREPGPADPDPSAVPGTTVTGTITGFGSVFVNGIEFQVDPDTEIIINGEPADEADLRLGMVVTVQGELDENGSGLTTNLTGGTANRIEARRSLEGIVSSIDAAGSKLTASGQEVIVDAGTVFENGVSLASLQAGNLVEVSGMPAAGGQLRATRIDLTGAAFTPGTDTIEVRGKISNLNTALQTFKLGAQTIGYAGAVLLDIPGSRLANGMQVLVRSAAAPAAGVLAADTIDGAAEAVPTSRGERVEVEGLVTAFNSSSNFAVNGTQVRTSGGTTFENGSAGDLGLDDKVEVEGIIDDNGILSAQKVSIRPDSNVRLEGRAQSADVDDRTVTIFGISVQVNPLTILEDKSNAADPVFTFEDIDVNDWLAVRGFVNDQSQVVATRIERRNAGATVELQGPASNLASPTFRILGATIQTGGGTTFRDFEDAAMTSAQFFNTAVLGTLVKAQGTLSGASTINATQVEIESAE